MSTRDGSELDDWLGYVAHEVGECLSDGALWVRLAAQADPSPLDYVALVREASPPARQALLMACWSVAVDFYVDCIVQLEPGQVLEWDPAAPQAELVKRAAAHAADAVWPRLLARFGRQVPAGMPQLIARRRERAAAAALRAAPSSIKDAAAAAGVSRRTMYRIMERKAKG